ncbi:hypothetical protein ABZ656_55220 [Streptomyces sp. NPDC007095]
MAVPGADLAEVGERLVEPLLLLALLHVPLAEPQRPYVELEQFAAGEQ